jgi:heat shock protein HslJ
VLRTAVCTLALGFLSAGCFTKTKFAAWHAELVAKEAACCGSVHGPAAAGNGAAAAPAPEPASHETLAGLADVDFTVAYLVVEGERRALASGRPPVMQFVAADRIAGFAGVNRFNGTFTLGGLGELAWSPALTNTHLPGPTERLALEQGFLHALRAATRLGVMADGVVFQSDDGVNVVEFRR